MGYRCRWLAVPASRDRAEVLDQLGLKLTAERNEEVYDPGFYLVTLPGWLVIMGDGWDYMDLVDRDQVCRLSSEGHDAIFFYTDDSPMNAELTGFRDGREVWSLQYADPELERGGELPAAVATVIDAAGDDVYDALANAGLALVGFRHDQTLGSGEHLPIHTVAKK
ncbi:MAG: hypothetical protein ABI678_16770 [Kofleriaceae bacterium]